MAAGSNAFYTQQYASAVELAAQQMRPRIATSFSPMTGEGKAATVVNLIDAFEADVLALDADVAAADALLAALVSLVAAASADASAASTAVSSAPDSNDVAGPDTKSVPLK